MDQIKFAHINGSCPTPQKTDGNAGYDLVATSMTETPTYIEYGTSLAVAIPEGVAGFLMPRSSISKYALIMCNSIGLVDPSYRGEVKARFKRVGDGPIYNVGDRVAQLVFVNYLSPMFFMVDSLPETTRGTGGFGSTGT